MLLNNEKGKDSCILRLVLFVLIWEIGCRNFIVVDDKVEVVKLVFGRSKNE